MKKILLDLAVTLDGLIEGIDGETDWCILEDDMDFDGFLSTIDTIFYGRKSYDTWGNYQPAKDADPTERKLWAQVHQMRKYVFSQTQREDSRATYISSDLTDAIKHIKQQDGKDIWLYGGASLIKTFINLNVVDSYRISVHPIALGKGKPLFEELHQRLELKHQQTRTFRSGVVQLIYESVRD